MPTVRNYFQWTDLSGILVASFVPAKRCHSYLNEDINNLLLSSFASRRNGALIAATLQQLQFHFKLLSNVSAEDHLHTRVIAAERVTLMGLSVKKRK